MSTAIRFIGVVHSPLKSIGDCPLQESEHAPPATIRIFPEYAKGTQDLLAGDEVILITWLHQADRTTLVTHPRNNSNAPLTGVFSTRSPDRPNPIGLHQVRILSRSDDGSLNVSALEVLDETPLIDIKPVL